MSRYCSLFLKTLQKCSSFFHLVHKPGKLVQIFFIWSVNPNGWFAGWYGWFAPKIIQYYPNTFYLVREFLQNCPNISHFGWKPSKNVQIFYIWSTNPPKIFKYFWYGLKTFQTCPNIVHLVRKLPKNVQILFINSENHPKLSKYFLPSPEILFKLSKY